jgi:hypothetical protein
MLAWWHLPVDICVALWHVHGVHDLSAAVAAAAAAATAAAAQSRCKRQASGNETHHKKRYCRLKIALHTREACAIPMTGTAIIL